MSGSGFRKYKKREEPEFEQNLVDVARVTRVKAGGKRLSFRALVVIGNRKGKVGSGVGKGKDVSVAVEKAVAKAEKSLIEIQIIDGTIAHDVYEKFGASKVLLKTAKQGRGIIAGGSVRTVLELVGIKNVVSKIHGSHNKMNNVLATINGLKKIRHINVNDDSKKVESEVKESNDDTKLEANN